MSDRYLPSTAHEELDGEEDALDRLDEDDDSGEEEGSA